MNWNFVIFYDSISSGASLSAILFFLKPCNALDFARLFHIVIAQYLSVFAKKYILGRIDFLRP